MPLDPDDTATTARDFVLGLMRLNPPPGTLIEVGLRNALRVELNPVDCPGYERFVVPDWTAFWQVPADGSMSSFEFQLADATDEWTDWGVEDCIFVDGYPYDGAPLVDPVTVTTAGPGPTIQIVRPFGNAAQEG